MSGALHHLFGVRLEGASFWLPAGLDKGIWGHGQSQPGDFLSAWTAL